MNDKTHIINYILAACTLLFVVVYVVQVNAMAAQAWRVRDVRGQLSTLQEARTTLVAQEAALGDREQLTTLAQRAGMIPASNIVYLVQDRTVAAR
jgi:hypothetical protein